MCLCSCAKEDMPVFKKTLYDCFPDKQYAHNALGNIVIHGAENFTTILQPLIVEGELVYGITSYGNKELLFVHDDDNYPIPENINTIGGALPKGLKMAAALETSLHLENVRKYHLENINSNTNRYFPKNPHKVFHRIQKTKILTQTPMGRLWLRVLNIFDPI